MKLTAKATLQIQKPVNEVFDAVVKREHITKYFISQSSGPMEAGKELIWSMASICEKGHLTI